MEGNVSDANCNQTSAVCSGEGVNIVVGDGVAVWMVKALSFIIHLQITFLS